MRLLPPFVVAGLLCGSLAHAQTPPPQTQQTGLTWRKQPSAEALERYYPPLAAPRDLNGYAVLRCRIGADGRLEACATVREEPADEGFGAAALALAWEFEAAVPADGEAPVGTTVDVPIRFAMTAEPASETKAEAERGEAFGDSLTFFLASLAAWFALWIVGTLLLVVWPARRLLKAAGVAPGWAWLFLVPALNAAVPWILAAQIDPARRRSS